MVSLTDIQKIAPWAASLPFLPKVLLTLLIIGIAVLLILLIWMPDPKSIKPLDDAIVIDNRDLDDSKSLRVETVHLDNSSNGTRKFFDITLANYGASPEYLSKFKVRWRYLSGVLASIEKGELLKPTTKFSVQLAINPELSGQTMEKEIDIYPPLLLPGTDTDNPSIITLRLEVYYVFDNTGGLGLDYHPSEDWDIEYDVYIVNNRKNAVNLVNGSWRFPQSEVSLSKPGFQDSQYISLEKLKQNHEFHTYIKKVSIDPINRRFRFRGGELVTLKVVGGNKKHKLFVYGYLPVGVETKNGIERINATDRRMYAVLRSEEQAQFLVPENLTTDFELQGTKVIPIDADNVLGVGNFSTPEVKPLPDDIHGVEGVSLSGIEEDFNIHITWETNDSG